MLLSSFKGSDTSTVHMISVGAAPKAFVEFQVCYLPLHMGKEKKKKKKTSFTVYQVSGLTLWYA